MKRAGREKAAPAAPASREPLTVWIRAALYSLAGHHHYRGAADVRNGDEAELVREATNPHDRFAVAVHHNGARVGYIPRDEVRYIAGAMDFGARLRGRFIRESFGGIGVEVLRGHQATPSTIRAADPVKLRAAIARTLERLEETCNVLDQDRPARLEQAWALVPMIAVDLAPHAPKDAEEFLHQLVVTAFDWMTSEGWRSHEWEPLHEKAVEVWSELADRVGLSSHVCRQRLKFQMREGCDMSAVRHLADRLEPGQPRAAAEPGDRF